MSVKNVRVRRGEPAEASAGAQGARACSGRGGPREELPPDPGSGSPKPAEPDPVPLRNVTWQAGSKAKRWIMVGKQRTSVFALFL